jgi:demethylmenaquinone methyltransferase / 2-methoxy-6-polyprenyl-1,4-benzoquinol methylase
MPPAAGLRPDDPVDDGPGRESKPVGGARVDGETVARAGNLVPEADVRELFDTIAPVYDRLNTLMTGGRDAAWRRAAVAAAALGPADAALDVACGTGRLAALLAERVGPFGRVVGVDLSDGMLERARAEYGDIVQLEFQAANALRLPFADATFDAATIGFGLRNLADFRAGFAELRRVVRPGGRVVCLELTMPRPRAWGRLFQATFLHLAPIAGRLAGVGGAYRYLPASLDGFPSAEGLAATMREAGLVGVGYRRLGLGSVALHVGTVPRRA